MQQSSEKSTISTKSAKDSMDIRTMNGSHVKHAKKEHSRSLTCQGREVQAQQIQEQEEN
jgi:hypothetical protein